MSKPKAISWWCRFGFHMWGKWRRHLQTFQVRRCVKCFVERTMEMGLLKKLIFKKPEGGSHEHFKEDIQRIVSVCEQKGYQISEQDAMIAWERYSEDYYAAGWLILPTEDSRLVDAVLKIMEEEK